MTIRSSAPGTPRPRILISRLESESAGGSRANTGHRAEAGGMTIPFPSPTIPAASRTEVFTRYLDYFRSQLISKVESLPPGAQRASSLPSGWTPVELLRHLTYVERRWLEWGFEGRPVGDPWGDQRDGRWYVGPDERSEERRVGK